MSHDLQRGRVADQLVQGTDEVGEAGPRRPVLLPAVQHQLVQVGGAVGRGGQPVVLLDGVDHLRGRGVVTVTDSCVEPSYNWIKRREKIKKRKVFDT